MLITRGFGFNDTSGGTGETKYVYAPDPYVSASSIGGMNVTFINSLPEVVIKNNQELKPALNSNTLSINVTPILLKPSIYIKED